MLPVDVPSITEAVMETKMNESGKNTETSIKAQIGEYWAELKLEYSWNSDGSLFSVKTLSYIAKSNGRSKGNIKLGLVSRGNTGWHPLTDSGIQDGAWHSFVKTLAVEGNANFADIHFNWIYDQAFPSADVNMTGQKKVSYPSS